MSDTYTRDEANTKLRETFQDLSDNGWSLEGSVTASYVDTDSGDTDRFAVNSNEVDVPAYDDLINEPSDVPTASEAGAGGVAPTPVEADTDGSDDDTFDDEVYTSKSAEERAIDADLDPKDIETRNDEGLIRVSDVEDQIAKDAS